MYIHHGVIPARAGNKVNFPSVGVTALTLTMDCKNCCPSAGTGSIRRAAAHSRRFNVCKGVLSETWMVNGLNT